MASLRWFRRRRRPPEPKPDPDPLRGPVMIARDLIPALDHPELVDEVLEVGGAEIARLIRYGDPRECDCCNSARDRHCELCHA